ncbi:MAG TPA: glutamate--tRNA ligase [Candidatus Saccharimonadales bacterium]|nr:glutamate--tRNA ligase [Candidatus Saccharimonadales bacterium]
MSEVRTRFAPSPTGALHCGTVRTALFAWLLAKHNGGKFLLRIEDTDQKREVEGGTDNIKESLRWLGLEWDEGPDTGGPYGPYIQSKRLEIYQKYARELYDKGLAYADPYTVEELDAFREKAKAEKRPFLFRDHRPDNPPAWDGIQPLRLKIEPKAYGWDDAIMGRIDMGPEMVDDYIIIKADGFPTYNFAHIVDDHDMGITHVLRSQEFIASIPKFLATHEALGWEPPINAIAPPVLGETGGTKLSKRKGALPVLTYRDRGFLPEALVNFMATLGWNDGTEQEIFSVAELIEKFSLERVQKSGARFDEQRLLWMNGAHIRALPLDDLHSRVENFWPEEAAEYDDNYKKQVLGLVQERLKYFKELPALTRFFFADLPVDPTLISTHKQLKKLDNVELKLLLEKARGFIAASDFSATDLTEKLNQALEESGQKPAVLFSLVRIATTQASSSPGLAETLNVLGRERSLARIDTQLTNFTSAA